MKRNVTYLKLFILINISNLYSFKFNKTTTKIFFNDILNFCKKNKKLTCSLSIPIVLSIGRLIYKKSEFYKLKKIENYEFFQIIKKKLNNQVIQNKHINQENQSLDKTNVEQIESYNINCSAYKFNINKFIKILNYYSLLKYKSEAYNFKLKDKVINALKIEDQMVANFVEDFEKANYKFQVKIISRIKKKLSLDQNEVNKKNEVKDYISYKEEAFFRSK